MELHNFPFDRQCLDMRVALETERYKALKDLPKWVDPSTGQIPLGRDDLPLEVLYECRLSEKCEREYNLYCPILDFDSDPQTIMFRNRVERKIRFYYFQVLIPVFLIVTSAFVCFSFDPQEHEARLAITVTIFLIIIAYQYVVTSMLPKSSYTTYLDKYVILSFFYSAALIAENGCIIKIEDADKMKFWDDVFLWVLLGAWAALHLFVLLFGQCCFRYTWEKTFDYDDTNERWLPRITAKSTFGQSVCLTRDPYHWSCEEVARYVEENSKNKSSKDKKWHKKIRNNNLVGSTFLFMESDELAELLDCDRGELSSLKIEDLKKKSMKVKTEQPRRNAEEYAGWMANQPSSVQFENEEEDRVLLSKEGYRVNVYVNSKLVVEHLEKFTIDSEGSYQDINGKGRISLDFLDPVRKEVDMFLTKVCDWKLKKNDGNYEWKEVEKREPLFDYQLSDAKGRPIKWDTVESDDWSSDEEEGLKADTITKAHSMRNHLSSSQRSNEPTPI